MAENKLSAADQALANLVAKREEVKERANQVALDLDITTDSKGRPVIQWSCLMDDLIAAAKPSESGKMTGLVVKLAGNFDRIGHDGTKYTMGVYHAKGGGAYIGLEVAKIEKPEPAVQTAKV